MQEIITLFADKIRREYGATEIILFGSYAKGLQTDDSDIDLLIVSDTNEPYLKRQASIRKIVRELKRKIPFAPIVLTRKELEDRRNIGDQFVEDMLATGIRV